MLYEVANEASGENTDEIRMPDGTAIPVPIGDTTEWQYWVIETVKRHEQARGYDRHPVGMTMQFPVPDQTKVNEPLFASPADWISPGFDDPMDPNADFSLGPPPGRWLIDPPPADGRKVVISDTDHYSPMTADPLWAWKSFLRGHNPILYDLGIIFGVNPPDPSAGVPSYESLEPARLAIGDTRRLADRIGLVDMIPAGELASAATRWPIRGWSTSSSRPADSRRAHRPTAAGHLRRRMVQPGDSRVGRWRAGYGRVAVGHRARPAAPSGSSVLYLKRTGA